MHEHTTSPNLVASETETMPMYCANSTPGAAASRNISHSRKSEGRRSLRGSTMATTIKHTVINAYCPAAGDRYVRP